MYLPAFWFVTLYCWHEKNADIQAKCMCTDAHLFWCFNRVRQVRQLEKDAAQASELHFEIVRMSVCNYTCKSLVHEVKDASYSDTSLFSRIFRIIGSG